MSIDVDGLNLRVQENNTNKGTDRGNEIIEKSLQELGAGRSIVVDEFGEAIAGSHVLAAAEKLGMKVHVVDSDGSELIVVRRTDLRSDSAKARALSVADNKASREGYNLDFDELANLYVDGVDLSVAGFNAEELTSMFGDLTNASVMLEIPDIDTSNLFNFDTPPEHIAATQTAQTSRTANPPKSDHDEAEELASTQPQSMRLPPVSSEPELLTSDPDEDARIAASIPTTRPEQTYTASHVRMEQFHLTDVTQQEYRLLMTHFMAYFVTGNNADTIMAALRKLKDLLDDQVSAALPQVNLEVGAVENFESFESEYEDDDA